MRRRSSKHGAWPLSWRLAGLAASLVAIAVASGGCGDDTCIIIVSTGTTLEWTVTLSVTGTQPIRALEADVTVEACSTVCDCHDPCDCDDDCDCSARFSSEHTELDCEPLVPATYRGSLDEDGTAHIALVADEAISAPAEILTCNYLSATEPSPSDFRIVVSGSSAKRDARLPRVAVTDISLVR